MLCCAGQQLQWLGLGWQAQMRYAGLVSLHVDAGMCCAACSIGRLRLSCQTTMQERCALTDVCCSWSDAATLILVQGSNLLCSDLSVQYRISPADLQTLGRAVFVSDDLLKGWEVEYLTDEKVCLRQGPHLLPHMIASASSPHAPAGQPGTTNTSGGTHARHIC